MSAPPASALPFRRPSERPDAIAPDGSEVRVLCALGRGSMALFTLPPGAVSRAVAHHRLEELWFVLGGRGRMWRRLGEAEDVLDLAPGLSLAIPPRTAFQFRCDGTEPLVALAVTMPPWTDASECYPAAGPWPPTL
ncbi:cupin domain-containing protein [Caldovatus aquaticus]|uniref:Cupin domain-containing protein n=1 Tax=Caldovatus aquaticus TaxID=2865671 RepID=A0ABS7F1A2_9PROT|nr:cupin domain-containing protein [Caldovatus aquaticus]MBW8269339.1 cupin domain-containing protein [Caldovatus aquaticus]